MSETTTTVAGKQGRPSDGRPTSIPSQTDELSETALWALRGGIETAIGTMERAIASTIPTGLSAEATAYLKNEHAAKLAALPELRRIHNDLLRSWLNKRSDAA